MKKNTSLKKQLMNNSGFTLVEMLAVVSIMAILSTVLFSMLSSTLRGSSKADILTDVQQSGHSVLTQMTRNIRFARNIESPSTCYSGPTPSPVVTTAITVRTSDNSIITYSCDNLPNGSISSNSAILTDSNIAVIDCSFTCRQNTAYDVPTIGISFSLNRRNANNQVENASPLLFQTTVSPRNISF